MKCAIDGIGLIGPGLAGWEASRAILAGAAYDAQAATVIAAPAMLPPAERRRVGVPVVVANAIPEAKLLAAYVTRAHGGHGAVREVAVMILKAQGKWRGIVEEFSQ